MGVGLKSLQESIDTTSSGGQLIFHMFGALAEFERHLIRERIQAGLNLNSAVGARQSSGKLLMLNQCLCLESSTMANPFGETL